MYGKIVAGVLVLGVLGGIGYGVWHGYTSIDERSAICEIAGKQVVLEKFNQYSDRTHYFTYGDQRIQPSQTVEIRGAQPTLNYFFSDKGQQFLVTWSEASKSWAISGVGSGWASVEGFTFRSSQELGKRSLWWSERKDGESQMGHHVFHLVGSALVKARSTEAGPNSIYVLIPDRAKGKFGPYADTTMPMWVEGKPVYVGWTSKVEERGAERVTTNAYVFSWNGQDMPIDCGLVNAPIKNAIDETRRCGADAGAAADCDAGAAPKAPVDDATYVKVVEAFDAPVCGGSVKIGLERRVLKRLVAGQDQTSETLMYSINGRRYPIGTVVHVAPNANVGLAL